MTNIILIYLVIINLVSFILFGIDKWRARHNAWRISEATLFLVALIGGSVGAKIGMHVWHHKTQHLSFIIGIPMIILLQVILFVVITRFII